MKRTDKKVRAVETASAVLRVRVTPGEYHEVLESAAALDVDVSEFVRLATRRYSDVWVQIFALENELESRALTTFECNVLAIVNPSFFLEKGGAELTKAPDERRKRR